MVPLCSLSMLIDPTQNRYFCFGMEQKVSIFLSSDFQKINRMFVLILVFIFLFLICFGLVLFENAEVTRMDLYGMIFVKMI